MRILNEFANLAQSGDFYWRTFSNCLQGAYASASCWTCLENVIEALVQDSNDMEKRMKIRICTIFQELYHTPI